MYVVPACMVCGERERTVVAEYNRLIFIESMWQSDLARFDYALCHGCGLVYATRRPERNEYEFLYDNFNEFLSRTENTKRFSVPELTDQQKEQIDSQFIPWWETWSVSIKGAPIRKRLRHELANALTYLPHIMLHVPLDGAKVLHIRAKSSTFADVMRKLLGAAQVDLITLFPSHKYLAEKNEGIRAESCLDYENFQIPFDEKYRLIIENHILLHTLDYNSTFEVFTSHLEEGGSILLQGELADNRLFAKGKNLFAELRPFHFQQFDLATVQRVLARYGFSPLVLNDINQRGDPEVFGIAKMTHAPGEPCPRIGAAELKARLAMYRTWRDESILSLPKERCRALFGSELDGVWKRVKASGRLKYKGGKVAAARRFHEAGHSEDELEAGSEILRLRNGLRARTSVWLAGKLKGTRLASRLATALPQSYIAKWIHYRAVSNPAATPVANASPMQSRSRRVDRATAAE
jgi:hypothetical protein